MVALLGLQVSSNRTISSMGRSPSCSKKKSPWTIDEDETLKAFITLNGIGNWQLVPEKCGIARCGKSCRLRWNNYLRPDIKRGHFTSSEEQKITQLHAMVGNRRAFIASHLPMRTDNDIKNYWNTVLKKRQCNESPSDQQLLGKGVVRGKAKPALAVPTATTATPVVSSECRAQSHIAEWETVRLEAEARLLGEAKMRSKLGAWAPIDTPEWRASSADAPFSSTLTLIPNGSADLRRRSRVGAVAQSCPQHLNATQLADHQRLNSPMQILSDPIDNFPPLPSHIARDELAQSPLIRSHRAQTGELDSDHNIIPLLDLEALLCDQANEVALLSVLHNPITNTATTTRDDWSASASYDQLQFDSIIQRC